MLAAGTVKWRPTLAFTTAAAAAAAAAATTPTATTTTTTAIPISKSRPLFASTGCRRKSCPAREWSSRRLQKFWNVAPLAKSWSIRSYRDASRQTSTRSEKYGPTPASLWSIFSLFCLFLNTGQPSPLFLSFRLFNTVESEMFNNFFVETGFEPRTSGVGPLSHNHYPFSLFCLPIFSLFHDAKIN